MGSCIIQPLHQINYDFTHSPFDSMNPLYESNWNNFMEDRKLYEDSLHLWIMRQSSISCELTSAGILRGELGFYFGNCD